MAETHLQKILRKCAWLSSCRAVGDFARWKTVSKTVFTV